MGRRILADLAPVRRRQRTALALRGMATGLAAGSLVGLLLGALRLAPAGLSLSPAWLVAAACVGPAVGGLLALVRPGSWGRAAEAVDASYGLKDRALTALDFAAKGEPTALQGLQMDDAEAHLARVDPRLVAPLRVPKILPYAAALLAAAVATFAWPRADAVRAEVAAPLDRVVGAAEEAEESLKDLEELARKENDPKLKELVKDLADRIEALKKPGIDVKEALAKFSEMQAAVAAQQAQYNVGLVDAQMQSLGEAMASTQALEGAGQSLQQGKYEKAAEELDAADPKFERKEAKALKDKLKQAAKGIKDAGLGELSEATSELAESLEESADSQGACEKLGKLARAQGRRKKIDDLLQSQCRSLAECKGNCQKNSTAVFTLRKKSERPSSNWGMSTSGNTDGDPTKLDSARKRDQVKGMSGEGPSESETSHSPEGRQVASREYQEAYRKYKKMTEAALDSEPIPLGHRQTIRRYFDLIRPQGAEADLKPLTDGPTPPGE